MRTPRARPAPLWRALAESFICEIEIGRLPPGARVPASRTLARELGVSRTTVAAAYDELVSHGYLRSRVGDGAYVAGGGRSSPPARERERCTAVAPDGTPLLLVASRR